MAHKMYGELASWWPLISPFEGYEEEAKFYWQILESAGIPSAATFLELGSGGGSNAYFLKHHFSEVVLTDLSAGMLAESRKINPECEHVEADMRTLRLGRQFDVVFVHDAIDYMLDLAQLEEAVQTVFAHCKRGGVALLVPDHVRETFEPSTHNDGTDLDGRALRYIEWTYDPDESDSVCTTDYVYILREGNGPTQVIHDQHIFGLFSRNEWVQLLEQVGFQVEVVRDEYGRDQFVARKPA